MRCRCEPVDPAQHQMSPCRISRPGCFSLSLIIITIIVIIIIRFIIPFKFADKYLRMERSRGNQRVKAERTKPIQRWISSRFGSFQSWRLIGNWWARSDWPGGWHLMKSTLAADCEIWFQLERRDDEAHDDDGVGGREGGGGGRW